MAQQRSILVVDDDDSIREIAQVSLELVGGWNVLTASSGLAALQHVALDAPDALLLDVMMPGLDGPSTVARLQQSDATRHIAVVLLTAKVQPAERQRFTALPGVTGVIAKPFDPMQLPAQVAELLGWPLNES
jgi:CheY-like chemotaxis protein